MQTTTPLPGIHHITAITASAADNLRFYETVLGLRLVKQTVNFDDPYTYHLYYGDAQGSPGTILTFFPWENLPPGRPGAGLVTAVNFTIPRRAIDFWLRRLAEFGVAAHTDERFGDPVIHFSDPHGLPLEFTGSDAAGSSQYWTNGPVAKSEAVIGFHSATSTLRSLDANQRLLADLMGMQLVAQEHNRYRFQMNGRPSPGQFYDISVDPDAPAGRSGNGSIHHIAFRTPSDATQADWRTKLGAAGLSVTPVRDRNYFRSIYFHAPEGVLFEIATDTPGFDVDEPVETLGATLKLPKQLEPLRADIQRRLPPLRTDTYRHLIKVPRREIDYGHTFVTLHGTGGSEKDLVSLARKLDPASAILSPRGDVLYNGMLRFFKRLAINVFDEADVVQRAHALADFILAMASRYGRDPAQISALGYSNGANIAAAVLLLRPEIFSRAILVRPMLPLQEPPLSDLSTHEILILKGAYDQIIPATSTQQLDALLRSAGSAVTTSTIDAGHEITGQDIEKMTEWLAKRLNHRPTRRLAEPVTH